MTEPLSVQVCQEEFAQSEPLTTRLHGLVRSYPKGVGIVQEFLQNADDAGAHELKVFLDERTHASSRLPALSMSELQGPALIFVNDAGFSPSDWKNIQQIGASGKALDATKTGRFGLGFNSVYNVTDFPSLLTGTRIGIFDPHGFTVGGASREHPGSAWRLESALWSECPDLLAPFEGFGLLQYAPEFQGTAFRLPLRTAAQAIKSEICQQPFTYEDFEAIVGKLRGDLCDLLLFLRNVQNIEIYHIDSESNQRLLLSARTANNEAVNEARSLIRQALETDHETLLNSLSNPNHTQFVSEFTHEIDFCNTDGTQSRQSHRVVNGIFGDTSKTITACARQMLLLGEKAVPLAGAAIRLDPVRQEGFRGRVFCSLPLPISSPLGICHVNGFFDLQADRQGLFEDPGAGGTSAIRVNWNRLLLEHCCSEAVARLCVSVSRDARSETKPGYVHWPRIPVQEQSLLDELPRHVYKRLQSYRCIAAGKDSAWMLPKDVLQLPLSATDALRNALLSDTFPLPNPALPAHALAGFAAAGSAIGVLSPSTLRSTIRVAADPNCDLSHAPRPCLRTLTSVTALLKFCASDNKVEDLLGVPLAVMSNGILRAFGRNQRAPICLGGVDERAIFEKVSHWFIDSSLEDLDILKDGRPLGTLHFTPQRVVSNLGSVLPNPGPEGRVTAESLADSRPTEDWLRRVFDYMASYSTDLKLDENVFKKLPLVTDQFGALHMMATASTPLLPGVDDSKTLLTALTELGVPLASGGEKLLKSTRGFIDAFPDFGVWRLSARDLIDTLSEVAPEELPLHGAQTSKHAAAILDYLATPRTVRDLKGSIADRALKLRKLKIFPTTSGKIISLESDDHYIPESYEMPDIATDIGLLDCGHNQKWLALYRALDVPTLSRARLLTRVILPRIAHFGENDCVRMLQWLRSNLHEIREQESPEFGATLLAQLGDSLPVSCADGQVRTPRRLYHPDSVSVAALLGDAIGFPDQSVYSERLDLWLEFFEELGMVRNPRTDDIVNAIDGIIASNEPNEHKATRLSNIAEYMDSHWGELKNRPTIVRGCQHEGFPAPSLVESLRSRAWLPSLSAPPRDYPSDLLADHASSFFMPSDILQRNSLHLAGSVRPICRTAKLFNLQSDIGLLLEPTLDEVLIHFENALSKAGTLDTPLNDRYLTIFKRVYSFLGRYFYRSQSDALLPDPRIDAIQVRFANRLCLVDSEGRTWLPKQCFADQVPSFLGRRARVRAESEEIDKGLQILGRRNRPVVSDYVDFFSELITMPLQSPLNEEDRILLRSAYRSAASLGDRDSYLGCPVLLESGELSEAAIAVLDDAPWLSERARSAKMLFFDATLGEAVATAFGVRLLSSAVYETPNEVQPCLNPIFSTECANLERTLQSAQLCEGIHRLLKSIDAPCRIEELKRFFSGLRVSSASEISTTLMWTDGDSRIENSDGSSDLVFDHLHNTLVISEDADDVLYERVGAVLTHELRLDGHDLGETAGYLVAILRVDPDAIDRHLTKLRVRALPADSNIATETSSDDLSGYIDDANDSSEFETSSSSENAELSSAADHTISGTVPVSSSDDQTVSFDAGSASDESDSQERASSSQFESAHPVQGVRSDSVEQESKQGAIKSERPKGPFGSSLAREADHVSEELSPDKSAQPHATAPPAVGRGQIQEVAAGSLSPHASQGHGFNTTSNPASSHESRLRSEQNASQRGRARTYVTPPKERHVESPLEQQRRQRVDQAAVRQVLEFESERRRQPKEMPHLNEGYDIESYLPDGTFDRFIEVKGSSGMWADFGVALSREQFRKASIAGDAFWLYVVEFALEPKRARVYAIQNPYEKVEEYWFDGGWRDLAQERGAPKLEDALKTGASILLDSLHRGSIIAIHKRGVLSLLEIELDDGSRQHLVYSPRRIQVLQANSEEEIHQ